MLSPTFRPGVAPGLLLAVGLVAGACSGTVLVSVCITDDDCTDGRCVDGSCGPVVPSLPPDWRAVTPDCAAPCGMFCCAGGEACDDGKCRPACASGVRCGWLSARVCCAEGQVCGDEQRCVTPPPPPPDCGTQVWDEALQACAGRIRVRHCERPGPGFQPEVLWRSNPTDGFDQVIVTPLVIDLDGDGIAEVVAPFHSSDVGHAGAAVLRALRGLDGSELWSVPASARPATGVSQPAAAILDFWEDVTVLIADPDGVLRAYDGPTGALRWGTRMPTGEPALCDVGWGAPAVADLDGDGRPEILCGFTVFDRFGVQKWSASTASGPLGSIVVAADLDLDGRQELTDGTRAYRHDGTLLWDLKLDAGLAAVADLVGPNGELGPDGFPEVVVTRGGLLELRSGITGELVIPSTLLPTWNGAACYPGLGPPGKGGPPAVGDLNGDGVPEVVAASGQCIGAMTLLTTQPGSRARWWTYWAWHAVDETSSVTGAALFDFQGDHSVHDDVTGELVVPHRPHLDVVHADETKVHLIQGAGGGYWYTGPHCSGTVYENPVVADVDGDGSADIVLGVNTAGGSDVGCSQGVSPGIVVLREKKSRWANARGIWNQHAYSPWTVCDGHDEVCAGYEEWGGHGRIPLEPVPPLQQVLARANTHGALRPRGGANAAVSDWKVLREGCPAEVTLLARVTNDGEAPLRAGTKVQLVRDGNVVGEAALSRPLQPATAKVLSFTVPAGGEAFILVDPDDATAECAEEDNVEGPVSLVCPR